MIGGLDHPNILVAHDAREVDGVAVLVTELIEGMDVGEIVNRNRCLEIADACAIVAKVCEALSYINSKNFVHRDIKPSNILVTDDAHVKLLDFGIAKIKGSPSLTTGFVGTPLFAAPEQIVDAESVDERSDLYSLGCVLFRCLTGDVVFPDDTTALRDYTRAGARKLQGCAYQIVLRELQTLADHPRRLHEWAQLAIAAAEEYA